MKMLSYENSGFSLDAKVKIQTFNENGLERLIRTVQGRHSKAKTFALTALGYTTAFQNHATQEKPLFSSSLQSLSKKISHFIHYPRRHRRYYHGAFAPNSPLRTQIAANAQKRLDSVAKTFQETVEKETKASKNWAMLISRIYEDPLICSACNNKIKIIAFVTHAEQIRNIITGIGWPTEVPEFNPPYTHFTHEICQLVLNTENGFYSFEEQCDTGPDPQKSGVENVKQMYRHH